MKPALGARTPRLRRTYTLQKQTIPALILLDGLVDHDSCAAPALRGAGAINRTRRAGTARAGGVGMVDGPLRPRCRGRNRPGRSRHWRDLRRASQRAVNQRFVYAEFRQTRRHGGLGALNRVEGLPI